MRGARKGGAPAGPGGPSGASGESRAHPALPGRLPLRRRSALAVAVVLAATVSLLAGCYSPSGALDQAIATTPVANTVRVSGWAYDRDTGSPVGIAVFVDGALARVVPAERARPDVAAAVEGAPAGAGFDLSVSATPGRHDVCVVAIDAAGDDANTWLGCHPVTVTGLSPACGARPSDPGWYRAMVTNRPDGWLGADLVNSVELPDGRALWLFGDTDWGTRAPSRAYDPDVTMTTNSAILQQGECTTALGRDGGFVSPGLYGDPAMLYWPSNAFVADGRLFIGYNRIRRSDLVRERSELVELSLPDLRPVGMQVMPDNGRQWTQAGNVEDGWVYYHGLPRNSTSLYVARAPVTDPVALEYWTLLGWSSDARAAVPVVLGAENGVVERLGDGRWIVLSKPFLQHRVVAWTGPSPVGPFVPSSTVYADAHPPAPEAWVYMPSLHRVPSGDWLFVLNHSAFDASYVRSGQLPYGPVFANAPQS